MFDVSLWEFITVIAVALVVIRPEDLPTVMRQIGKIVRKINALSREFYACLEDMTDEVTEPLDTIIKEEKELANILNDKTPMQG